MCNTIVWFILATEWRETLKQQKFDEIGHRPKIRQIFDNQILHI